MEPYIPTFWKDEIIDPVDETVVQEGTNFNAFNMNKIEAELVRLGMTQRDIYLVIARLAAFSELDGRVTGAQAKFFDMLDGEEPHYMRMSTAKAIMPQATAASSSPIQLNIVNAVDFSVGQEVTVYDDVHLERVMVTAVVAGKLTLSRLQNSYKKGAVIARTTLVMDAASKTLKIGGYKTYEVSISEL